VSVTGVLAFVGVSAGIVALFAVLLRPAREPRPEALNVIARRTALWRCAGVVLGVVVAYSAAGRDPLGRGEMLAAPLFGLCVLAGVLAGESTVRAPDGTTRRAAVEVRRARDYLPRSLGTAVAVAAGVLFGVLGVTTALGSPDDMGRAGRSLVLQCTDGATSSIGPWAGSFYSVPLAVVVIAGLVAAGAVLRRVVRRPRPGGDAATVVADDALRRDSARTIVGAAGILVTIPLAGVLFVTGVLVRGMPHREAAVSGSSQCAPEWWTLVGSGLLGATLLTLALLGWCGATLLFPYRASRAAAPSAVAAP
jgi:hypothetical protein